MQTNHFRTAATLALISAALATTALTPAALAQQRRFQGGGAPAAPAVHVAPPAPHIAAPAPPPHIAAPVHIAAPPPVHVAPQVHIAAPVHAAPVHVATPRVTPSHVAPSHIATPQVVHRNINASHQNVSVAHHEVAPTRHVEPDTNAVRHGTPTNLNTPNTKLATPNTVKPGKPVTNAAKIDNKANATNPNISEPNKLTGKNPTTSVAPDKTKPVTAGKPPVATTLADRGRETAKEHELARQQIYAANRKPVLQNQSFAELARRDPAARNLTHAEFRGRLAELNGFRDRDRDRDRDRFEERRRFHGIVLGWIGPVFWPYAYQDFVDYTFYPYVSDTFWPYAYDDVYDSIFAGYAPDWSPYASVSSYGGGASARVRTETTRRLASVGLPTTGAPEVCSAQAPALTDWPIEQIAQQVQLDDNQRALLDQLRDASTKSISLLQASCPTDLPSTPTGRLTGMRQRISSMLQAVQLVRPALERLYQSLSDEQRERFNALDIANSPAARTARASQRQGDLTQVCSTRAAQPTGLPSERIAQILQLDDNQRAALDQVKSASAKAADILSQNCAQDQSLTPTGRLAAMEQRLSAMLQAIDTVQPALAQFYGSLSDEQKARFNRLPRQV
jgi:ABC-type transporter MlaC component